MEQRAIFDADLIRRYDTPGPRYTSYPTAAQFHEGITAEDYRQWAEDSNTPEFGKKLSLYFHIPFCDTVCFFCGCNKIATKDRGRNAPYLQHLYQDMQQQAQLFDSSRVVEQLHWGGGTPTFLGLDQMAELMDTTRQQFSLRDDDLGEYSIEIDPRTTNPEGIAFLRQQGFNRISMGVQDFNPEVQKAVNRIQPQEQTLEILDAARTYGYRSTNIDLIYGLPFQTPDSFKHTLETIITASPDRLSIFNYAHMPHLFPPQRRINDEDLPSPEQKLDILEHTIEQLIQAGYVYIGMDHFAKPDDSLSIAQKNGTLHRNFQGYSTHADCDLVGMGVSSISKVAHGYSQNVKKLDDYYQRINSGQQALFRGVETTHDDRLRCEIIMQLMCHSKLDFAPIENAFNITFGEYFSTELTRLSDMQKDGLLQIDASQIQVSPQGRLLMRNICLIFDRYLKEHQQQPQTRFSRTI
jgi:oxygen-independent coproporphyrinogen III oxidase